MIAVPYELGCDPHGHGEDFAEQIRDACADERAIAAAREGLIVAVKILDGNIVDMDGCDDSIIEDLLALPDEHIARLKAAIGEYDRVVAEGLSS